MRQPSFAVTLFLTTLLATGCGGKKSDGGSVPAAATPTPAPSTSGSTTVLAVSRYDSGPRAAEAPVDAAKAEQGEKLFQTKGCSACHAFGKKVTGPDLAGVTRRRTAVWIENQILHPEVMTKEDPIAHDLFAKLSLQMPNQKLTEDEARAVIEYFKHKDKEAGEAH
jgi:mono/diheme cytochrome c family protein